MLRRSPSVITISEQDVAELRAQATTLLAAKQKAQDANPQSQKKDGEGPYEDREVARLLMGLRAPGAGAGNTSASAGNVTGNSSQTMVPGSGNTTQQA